MEVGISLAARAGEIVCGYRLLRALGSRASSRYVAARRAGDAASLCIVELFQESEIVARNARALAPLRHPNLLPLRGVIVEGGVIAVESEFVEGEWLSDLLERGWKSGSLPLGALLRVLIDVLDGLSALQESPGRARWALKRPEKADNSFLAPIRCLDKFPALPFLQW